MPKHYESVKAMIADRKQIPSHELKHQVLKAIDMALASKEDALALVETPNRIVQAVFGVVPFKLMVLIADYKDDDEFITRLFRAIEGTAASQPMKTHLEALKREAQGGSYLEKKSTHSTRDTRTHAMGVHNPDVYQVKEKPGFFLQAEDKSYPVVDRATRDFTHPIVSAGSGNREHILLDVDNQVLDEVYRRFVKSLAPEGVLSNILLQLGAHTKKLFQSKDVSGLERVNENVPLSRFMLERRGVCRHHSLLNAYILSRMSKDERLPSSLQRTVSEIEVIHHRQSINGGAHTWNIVKSPSGEVFNVDSLWRNGVFALDPLDLTKQDRFYMTDGIGKLMIKNHQCFVVKEREAGQVSENLEATHECKQQLFIEIVQKIEAGEIPWDPLAGGHYERVSLRTGKVMLMHERLKAVYDLALKGSESPDEGEKAFQSIKALGEKLDIIQHRGKQPLVDYIKERLAILSCESEEQVKPFFH